MKANFGNAIQERVSKLNIFFVVPHTQAVRYGFVVIPIGQLLHTPLCLTYPFRHKQLDPIN
jgi:hypothetical protein